MINPSQSALQLLSGGSSSIACGRCDQMSHDSDTCTAQGRHSTSARRVNGVDRPALSIRPPRRAGADRMWGLRVGLGL
eukprot:6006856-Pyramimonas_sp.AAC.2